MILFDDYEADALYAGVLENPGDDLRRLVLADRLEEVGLSERAEFIRVQCDPLIDTACAAECRNRIDYKCDRCALVDRENELAEGYLAKWFSDIVPTISRAWFDDPDSFGDISTQTPAWIMRRGFPAEVRAPLAWLLGGDECTGTFTRRCVAGTVVVSEDDGWHEEACPTCYGTGRTPGRLAGLLERWPIETVVVTGLVPAESHPQLAALHGSTYWYWPFGFLPFEVMSSACLSRRVDPAEFTNAREVVRFPTIAAAQEALSAAVLEVTRG